MPNQAGKKGGKPLPNVGQRRTREAQIGSKGWQGGPPVAGYSQSSAEPSTKNRPTQKKAAPYPDKGAGFKHLGRFATGKKKTVSTPSAPPAPGANR